MAFVDSLDAPELADDDRHHLARVLRVRPGAPMTVCDGRGGWRTARFGDEVEPVGPIEHVARSEPSIAVGFAIPKGDRPELIVQKLTELGVDRVVPLVTDRAVVRWDATKADRQRERFVRVAREAAMQCRRTWLPTVDPVGELATVAADAVAAGVVVALAERGGRPVDEWAGAIADSAGWLVAVGPEGGWTSDELGLVAARVALGDHVLRVETAAIAAAVLTTAERARRMRPA